MIVEIKVERESVLFAVKQQTYKTGEASKEGETMRLATETQANDDDDSLINGYIDTAVSRVLDILTGLLEKVEVTEEEVTEDSEVKHIFTFSLDTPMGWDANQNKPIQQGAKDYMFNYSLFMWYLGTWPQKAAAYQALADEELRKINHRAMQRVKPARRTIPPMY